MSGSRLLIGCLTATTLFSLICVCTAENKTPANPSADVLQKIAALEKRVVDLEKRLARQEQTPPAPNSVYQAGGVAASTTPNVPHGSIPRSINGTQFYIVPLSKQVAR